jgi:hypothetical protein
MRCETHSSSLQKGGIPMLDLAIAPVQGPTNGKAPRSEGLPILIVAGAAV